MGRWCGLVKMWAGVDVSGWMWVSGWLWVSGWMWVSGRVGEWVSCGEDLAGFWYESGWFHAACFWYESAERIHKQTTKIPLPLSPKLIFSVCKERVALCGPCRAGAQPEVQCGSAVHGARHASQACRHLAMLAKEQKGRAHKAKLRMPRQVCVPVSQADPTAHRA